MGSEKFCLKWNDFQTNISSSFSDLRKEQDFSDVTLTCDGNQQIQAHKVVLAASSSFFRRVLKLNNNLHHLLYMRGMNTSQLSDVVDFIYHGEVNIFQEDLDSFLALAEELELKGLDRSEESQTNDKPKATETNTNKSSIKASEQVTKRYESETLMDASFIKEPDFATDSSFEESSMVPADTYVKTQTNNEELDETINSMIDSLGQGGFACKVCGKIELKFKKNMKNHIEGKHIEGTCHQCSHCGKTTKSRESLRIHVFRHHKV